MSVFALAMQYLPMYGLVASAIVLVEILLLIVERALRDRRNAVKIADEADKVLTSVEGH